MIDVDFPLPVVLGDNDWHTRCDWLAMFESGKFAVGEVLDSPKITLSMKLPL